MNDNSPIKQKINLVLKQNYSSLQEKKQVVDDLKKKGAIINPQADIQFLTMPIKLKQ